MKYALLALAAFLIVTATVTGKPHFSITTQALPAAGPIVISDDFGGAVSTYSEFYRRIVAANIYVKVDGICVSACTLVLSLPMHEMCVTPRASFGFHQASIAGKPVPEITEVLIRRYYPAPIQKWIEEHGPLVEEPIYMSAATLVSMGIFPWCRP